MRRSIAPIYDQAGELVTQERWNSAQAELSRLRNSGHKRILRLPAVESRVGLRKTQIYELMATGRFPCAVKLSERAIGWLEHEIDAYIDERASASRCGYGPERGGLCGGPVRHGEDFPKPVP